MDPVRAGTTVRKRNLFVYGPVFLLLLLVTGIASGATPNTTITTLVPTSAVITPEKIGGSIFFDTYPTDATILLDGTEIGNSPITYYSGQNETFEVRIHKHGYEDFTDTVTVSDGKRVVFSRHLTPLEGDLSRETTPEPTVPVATVIIHHTPITKVPTPWPETTRKSPVDPAVILGAVGAGTALFVFRRR